MFQSELRVKDKQLEFRKRAKLERELSLERGISESMEGRLRVADENSQQKTSVLSNLEDSRCEEGGKKIRQFQHMKFSDSKNYNQKQGLSYVGSGVMMIDSEHQQQHRHYKSSSQAVQRDNEVQHQVPTQNSANYNIPKKQIAKRTQPGAKPPINGQSLNSSKMQSFSTSHSKEKPINNFSQMQQMQIANLQTKDLANLLGLSKTQIETQAFDQTKMDESFVRGGLLLTDQLVVDQKRIKASFNNTTKNASSKEIILRRSPKDINQSLRRIKNTKPSNWREQGKNASNTSLSSTSKIVMLGPGLNIHKSKAQKREQLFNKIFGAAESSSSPKRGQSQIYSALNRTPTLKSGKQAMNQSPQLEKTLLIKEKGSNRLKNITQNNKGKNKDIYSDFKKYNLLNVSQNSSSNWYIVPQGNGLNPSGLSSLSVVPSSKQIQSRADLLGAGGPRQQILSQESQLLNQSFAKRQRLSSEMTASPNTMAFKLRNFPKKASQSFYKPRSMLASKLERSESAQQEPKANGEFQSMNSTLKDFYKLSPAQKQNEKFSQQKGASIISSTKTQMGRLLEVQKVQLKDQRQSPYIFGKRKRFSEDRIPHSQPQTYDFSQSQNFQDAMVVIDTQTKVREQSQESFQSATDQIFLNAVNPQFYLSASANLFSGQDTQQFAISQQKQTQQFSQKSAAIYQGNLRPYLNKKDLFIISSLRNLTQVLAQRSSLGKGSMTPDLQNHFKQNPFNSAELYFINLSEYQEALSKLRIPRALHFVSKKEGKGEKEVSSKWSDPKFIHNEIIGKIAQRSYRLRFVVVNGNNSQLIREALNRRSLIWKETAVSQEATCHFKWQPTSQGIRYDQINNQSYQFALSGDNVCQRQLINHLECHQQLSEKSKLFTNMVRFQAQQQGATHQENVFDFMPVTFFVEIDNSLGSKIFNAAINPFTTFFYALEDNKKKVGKFYSKLVNMQSLSPRSSQSPRSHYDSMITQFFPSVKNSKEFKFQQALKNHRREDFRESSYKLEGSITGLEQEGVANSKFSQENLLFSKTQQSFAAKLQNEQQPCSPSNGGAKRQAVSNLQSFSQQSSSQNYQSQYQTHQFLQQQKYRLPLCHFSGHNFWLLKPTKLNRGRGIHVCNSLSTIKSLINQYCEGFKRATQPQVVATQVTQNQRKADEQPTLMKENTQEQSLQYLSPKLERHPTHNEAPLELEPQKQLQKLRDQLELSVAEDSDSKNQQNQNACKPRAEGTQSQGNQNRTRVISKQQIKMKHNSFILQKYIERPLLIHGRKFDVRVWVLVNYDGCVYMFKEGYLRTSSSKFSIDPSNPDDQFVHLTNNAIQKYSNSYGSFEDGNQMSYQGFQEYLDAHGYQVSVRDEIVFKFKQLIVKTVFATKTSLDPHQRKGCFELFGYDFILDEDLNVWLIEVNTNPCIEESSRILKVYLPRMIDDLLKLSVDSSFKDTLLPCYEEMDGTAELSIPAFEQDQVSQNERLDQTATPKSTTHKKQPLLERQTPEFELKYKTYSQLLEQQQLPSQPVEGYLDAENMWEILVAMRDQSSRKQAKEIYLQPIQLRSKYCFQVKDRKVKVRSYLDSAHQLSNKAAQCINQRATSQQISFVAQEGTTGSATKKAKKRGKLKVSNGEDKELTVL